LVCFGLLLVTPTRGFGLQICCPGISDRRRCQNRSGDERAHGADKCAYGVNEIGMG
jgi:hypothetical protein